MQDVAEKAIKEERAKEHKPRPESPEPWKVEPAYYAIHIWKRANRQAAWSEPRRLAFWQELSDLTAAFNYLDGVVAGILEYANMQDTYIAFNTTPGFHQDGAFYEETQGRIVIGVVNEEGEIVCADGQPTLLDPLKDAGQ